MDEEENNNTIKSIVSESQQLLDSLYKDEKPILDHTINTQDDLRKEVSNFVGNQMAQISRQSVLQDLIIKELIDKIALHELSTEELRGLLRETSVSKSQHTTALLDLFKPTQQSNALMVAPSKEVESDSINLTSEQRNSMDKLLKVVEAMNSSKENINEI